MKVLVVDDREDNLYLLESLLGGNGFETDTAREGQEALEKARRTPPGLVISDILMPGMDGFALCREWKKDPILEKIPFVFYTFTYTDPRDEQLALDMGADRFILKPAEPVDFMKVIRDVLAQYEHNNGIPAKKPIEPETVVLKEYNEALVRKLEDKLADIELLNQSLDEKDKRLLHINRVLRGIRAVNQLIVKERDRDTLTPEACRRIVEGSGYDGAWIMLTGPGNERLKFSQAGFEEKSFESRSDLFCEDDLPPCCRKSLDAKGLIISPAGSDIHEGCPMISLCGMATSMTAPLTQEGKLYGFLLVLLPRDITADEEEVSLLSEMAGDLAYSLDNISMAEARQRSDATLRATFDSAIDGIILYDPDADRLVRFNRAISKMLGYSPEEMERLKMENMHPAEDLPGIMEDLKNQISGVTPLAVNIPMKRKDGSIFYADVNSSPLVIDGRLHVLGIFRDVSGIRDLKKKERDAIERLRRALATTIHVLSQILERRDPYTAGHQRRVAALAGEIAREMGFDQERIDGIIMTGQVHDIGKISVPAEILSKPGKISEMELRMIREHPIHGRDILKDVDSPLPLSDIVYQHHERLDGSGYPRGIKGEEILLEARIIAVADVVEAMASHRPYRPSHGIDVALDEIERNRGVLYDEKVVDACVELFRHKGYVLPD